MRPETRNTAPEGAAHGSGGHSISSQDTRPNLVTVDDPGRIPPHNLDAEASLLGAMLLSVDAIAAAVEIVTVDDFYKPTHGHIFAAITTLHGRGDPADPITVAEELKRAGLLESVGGAGTLVDLESQTPASTNAAYYAQIVTDRAVMRKLIGTGSEITQLGYDLPDDVPAAVDTARTLVDRLGLARCRATPEDLFVEWAPFWSRERNAEWLVPDVLALGRGHAIYGGRKLGKSLLILALAAELAQRDDVIVLLFDYEMSLDDTYERLSDFGYGPESDLSRLRYCSLPTIPSLDTAEGGARIEAIVKAEQATNPDAHIVVIIDTFGRAVTGDENDADTVRSFFRHTGTRLKRLEVTWVRVDHTGKDGSKGQRGSSAKNDDVDLVWQLRPTDNGIELRREHARMAWVPERVTFQRDDGPPLRFVKVAQDWPAGTAATAADLDDLEVPVDATSTVAISALKSAAKGRRRAVVLAALRYRQEASR